MNMHPAITISRSLGSGGTEVGFLVARQLGWRFCDRRILRQAAQAAGLTPASMGLKEERFCGFLEHLMSVIAVASPETPYTPPPDLPVYSADLFQLERGIMRKLLQHHPCVLVGRGGFLALKDHPRALHVSIRAELAFRIRFLMERGKAPDPEAAQRAIKISDRNRAAYIRGLSGQDWNDPKPFQLVLDTSRDGLQACADRIVAEERARFPLEPKP